MKINRNTLALTLVLFAAMTVAASANALAPQFGPQAGECFRSGYMSVTCAPAAPRYFNRVERGDETRSFAPRRMQRQMPHHP